MIIGRTLSKMIAGLQEISDIHGHGPRELRNILAAVQNRIISLKEVNCHKGNFYLEHRKMSEGAHRKPYFHESCVRGTLSKAWELRKKIEVGDRFDYEPGYDESTYMGWVNQSVYGTKLSDTAITVSFFSGAERRRYYVISSNKSEIIDMAKARYSKEQIPLWASSARFIHYGGVLF